MENINVVLRVRPLNQKERNSKDQAAWQVINQNTLQALPQIIQDQKIPKQQYQYDYCYRQEDDNESIYDNSVQKIVLSSLHGINGSIFMYGQTGSGKTYSMMGYNQSQQQQGKNKQVYNIKKNQYSNSRHDGILQNSLRDLFQNINADSERTYILKCQYIEIYNDQVYDLLQTPDKLKTPLQISQDQNQRFYLKGIREISVSSQQEIFDTLSSGEINRHYASTRLNHKSSRSHVIFRLTVQSLTSKLIKKYRQQSKVGECNVNNTELLKQLQTEARKANVRDKGAVITESELNFVDLAGSEKVSIHDNIKDADDNDISNKRINEGKHINKSLFFLTQIIQTRSKGKNHVPYRNSPLTKILKYSLEGNSRNLIICCISPAQSQIEQTVSTLRFGLSARQITNTIQINIQSKSSEEALGILLSGYERKIRDLGIQKENDKQRILYLKNQVEKLFYEKKDIKQKQKFIQGEFLSLYQQEKEKLNQMQNLQIENQVVPQSVLTIDSVLPMQTNIDPINQDGQFQFVNKMEIFNKEYKQSIKQNLLKFDKSQDKYAHLNNIGDVFLTKNNKTIDEQEQQILQPDWQNLIYDFQGKFAFKAFQKAKNKCNNYQKAYMLVSEKSAKFMKKLNKDLQQTSESLDLFYKKNELNLESFQEFYSHNITELVHQCKGLEQENYEMKKRIHTLENEKGQMNVKILNYQKQIGLYKDFNGGNTLNSEKLLEFENHIQKLLDVVKEERISRTYKKQIFDYKNQQENDKEVQLQNEQEYNQQFNNQVLVQKQFQPIELNFIEPKLDSKYEQYLNKTPQFQQNEKIQQLEKTIRQINQFSIEMQECYNMGKESEKKHIDLEKTEHDIVNKLKEKCNDIIIQEITAEKIWEQRRQEIENLSQDNFQQVQQLMKENKQRIQQIEEQKKQQQKIIQEQQQKFNDLNKFGIQQVQQIMNKQKPNIQLDNLENNTNNGDITGRLSEYIGKSPKNNFQYFTQQDQQETQQEEDEEFDELQLQLDLQNIEKEPFTTENDETQKDLDFKFQYDIIQSQYKTSQQKQSIYTEEDINEDDQEDQQSIMNDIKNQLSNDQEDYLQTFGSHTPVKFQDQKNKIPSYTNLTSNKKHKKSSSVNLKAEEDNIYSYQTLQSASTQKPKVRNTGCSTDKKKPAGKTRSISQYNSIDYENKSANKKNYMTTAISDKKQVKEFLNNNQTTNKELQLKINQKQQQLIQFNKSPLHQQNPNIIEQKSLFVSNQKAQNGIAKRSISMMSMQQNDQNYNLQPKINSNINNENKNILISNKAQEMLGYSSASKTKNSQFQNFLNQKLLSSQK